MSRRIGKWKPLRTPILVLMTIVGLGIPVLACGPFFAPNILSGGDQTLLAAPTADIRLELANLKPRRKPPESALPPKENSDEREQTLKADLGDLEKALLGVESGRRAYVLSEYEKCRNALETEIRASRSARGKADRFRGAFQLPVGLPSEFGLYFQASITYHRGDLGQARLGWERILALAPSERRYRTTWALFMLGKCHMKERPDLAVDYFRKVREAAAGGFADRLGLAAASYGWQARVELDQGHLNEAMELYVTQMATGDPTAALSLRNVAAGIFKSMNLAQLRDLAGKETSRRILTSYLVAKGGPFSYVDDAVWINQVKLWLNTLEALNLTSVENADRLGWAAYQAGDFAAAQRWLGRSGLSTPVAKWIQAKLLLRGGKTAEAIPMLADALRQLPGGEIWDAEIHNGMDGDCEFKFSPSNRVRGELGSVQFARQDFVQALHNFLLAGYWEDAAYVAERVLTAEELKRYVDIHWPQETLQPSEAANSPGPEIRHLLARKLTRLGRWKDARPYYSPEVQTRLDSYVGAIRRGHDRVRSERERAQAFWSAALIARQDGMELLATELGPDGATYDGAFDQGLAAKTIMPYPEVKQSLFPGGQDLTARLKANVPVPDKRFHYRYVACEHAWTAAALMPDQTDETARILCIAGTWIKDRDPQAADRFYKALVRRCGQTDLGRAAGKLRWFPELKEQ